MKNLVTREVQTIITLDKDSVEELKDYLDYTLSNTDIPDGVVSVELANDLLYKLTFGKE